MTYGPVDILALEFDGNKFKGEILDALIELVEQETIRIIDLIIVVKDGAGNVTAIEMDDLKPDVAGLFDPLSVSVTGMMTEADIIDIAEELTNNSSAAIMLYENLWAIKFKDAVLEANGRVLLQERIPHEVILSALVEMATLDESAS